MPAAALAVGTIVDANGMRGVVAGFTRPSAYEGRRRVIVVVGASAWFLDPSDVWSLPCAYNRDVAAFGARKLGLA